MEANAIQPRSWLNLRTRLRLLMLVLLLPGLAYIITASVLERQRARAEALAQLAALARQAASEEQQSLQDIQIRLALVAALDAVQKAASGSTAQDCDNQLHTLAAAAPAGASFAAWNLAGQRVCGTTDGTAAANAAQETWFRRTVDSQAFSIGDFEVDGARGVSVIGFGYPITGTNHETLGVVAASLDMPQLAPATASPGWPADMVVTVFTPDGRVLARSVEAAQWVQKRVPDPDRLAASLASGANSMERADVDGVMRLSAFAPMTGPGGQLVYLSAGRPAANIYGPVDLALLAGLAITAALTLLAVLLAAGWGRQALERPMQDLLAVSQRLAHDDLTARARAETEISELDRLAGAVNVIADKLEHGERQRLQGEERQLALEEQLRRSQARATQLEAVAAGLTKASTPAEVIEVILRQGASALGAVSVTLLLLSDNEQWLQRAAHAGQPDSIERLFPRFPVSSPLPAADVVRTGEAMWIHSAAAYRARYPQLIEVINSTDYEAAAALPLRVAGRLMGVLVLSFPGELGAGAENSTYLASLGSLCALGLERVGVKDLML